MQSSAKPEAPLADMEPFMEDKEALLQRGMEVTLNHKGCTYHIFGPPEEHWLTSLPESNLPLLDAGACYGIQTVHAMKAGRDVIAIDMCEEHISVLRSRVANLQGPAIGKLVKSIVAELPDPDVVTEASVSGILCSEMIHFHKPGQMRPQFKHFFKWLAPGGKLVVTAASWPPRIKRLDEIGLKLSEGRSAKELLKMLNTVSPSELVDAAPGLMWFSDEGPWKKLLGEFIYTVSTVELRELAESSGFVVKDVRYYAAGKYGNERSNTEPETAFLVAQKPA